jgi:hypothetical protein
MKDFDKILKESLENHELPYNASAWESLSSKLDANNLVKPTHSSKFWIASAVVVSSAAILTLFFVLNTQEKKELAKNEIPASKTELKKEEEKQNKEVSEKISTPENASSISSEKNINSNKKISVENLPNTIEIEPKIESNTENKKTGENKITPTPIVFPDFKSTYCLGSSVQISNQNDVEMYVLLNGKILTSVNKKSSKAIQIKEAGNYSLAAKEESSKAFYVPENASVDFTYDELLYDRGLPFNHVKALTNAKQLEWKNAQQKVLSRESEFDIHLYKKGSHPLTLQVTDEYGCKHETTKSIRVEVDYNLLAVTGIDPLHPDARRKTFIPYALIERSSTLRFEMRIVDRNRRLIYSTKDANRPWDGFDPFTNDILEKGVPYFWEVILENPEPGEKNAYSGIIQRL